MLPEHAPFNSDQRSALDSLLCALDPVQRGWLGGFLSVPTCVAADKSVPVSAGKLTVLYGTESGNSENLAARAVKDAKKRGFQAVMKNMSETSPAELTKISNLLVIVSTWGDGEPPECATAFYNELMATTASFAGVHFSVCALGDTSYEKFCQTGKDIDERLAFLGGTRVTDRVDCDVDYEESFVTWLEISLKALAPASPVVADIQAPFSTAIATEFGKKNPFPAEVLEVVELNGEGSQKETLHLEFSLVGSGMTYVPGDALAVVPHNALDTVQAILTAAKRSGNEQVEVKGIGPKRLDDALREDLDITALSRNVLTKLQSVVNSAALQGLLAEDAKELLKNYMAGREIIDALHDFVPDGISGRELVGIFRKLPPRLYSIASSPLAHPDEVHLTVAAVRYQTHGRERKGVCSTYLADMVKPGDATLIYVQPNKNFRLPEDGLKPIIMVGPGTGIAPFRSFVEHRAALGSSGKNWLFMGDQHYLYDFLYQLEWQEHLKNGTLTRLDVAFSRDQPEKVYVQHKMLEHAADVFAWLEEGAHFYVCGDANRMAADVHEALISIVQTQGGTTREAAETYLEDMKKTKRYQRDVY